MNCIGIIGAMEEEVACLKEVMEDIMVSEIASMEFYEGTLEGREVVVVRCGVGKVNAGICTQILASVYHVDAVINTGIAGSLRDEINIGDLVLSTDAVQHDVDATSWGYAKGQIPRMDLSSFVADGKMAEIGETVCRKVNPEIEVFKGRVLSGDQFISSGKVKQDLIEKFQGCCVEMEGAAVAQAAVLNKIPFLIIRAISDKADDSAAVDYGEFEKKAINHCVNLTRNMLKYL